MMKPRKLPLVSIFFVLFIFFFYGCEQSNRVISTNEYLPTTVLTSTIQGQATPSKVPEEKTINPEKTNLPKCEIPNGELVIKASGGKPWSFIKVKTNGEIKKVITDGFFIAGFFSLSPDGKLLAFSGDNNLPPEYQIKIIEINSGETKQITFPPFAKSDVFWSPDGKYLAYVEEGDQRDIAIVTPDGLFSKKITYTEGSEFGPIWSPDMEKIAYVNYPATPPIYPTLWIMDAYGQNARQLSHLAIVDRPSWSPDGQLIAFTAQENSDAREYCGEIYILNITNGDLEKINEFPSCSKNPRWSPDGNYLVALYSESEITGNPFEEKWEISYLNLTTKQLCSPKNDFPDFIDFEWIPK